METRSNLNKIDNLHLSIKLYRRALRKVTFDLYDHIQEEEKWRVIYLESQANKLYYSLLNDLSSVHEKNSGRKIVFDFENNFSIFNYIDYMIWSNEDDQTIKTVKYLPKDKEVLYDL